jgi:hypothetical protein
MHDECEMIVGGGMIEMIERDDLNERMEMIECGIHSHNFEIEKVGNGIEGRWEFTGKG